MHKKWQRNEEVLQDLLWGCFMKVFRYLKPHPKGIPLGVLAIVKTFFDSSLGVKLKDSEQHSWHLAGPPVF